MTKEDKDYGKAYAFLKTKAPENVLPLVIEDARERYHVPNELELAIIKGPENLQGDEKLRPHIKRAFESGMGYALEAKCRGMTNAKTADELKSILNGIYLGSKEVDRNYDAFVLHEEEKGYLVQEKSAFLKSRYAEN